VRVFNPEEKASRVGIDAGDKAVKLEAVTLDGKADGQIKLKSGASAEAQVRGKGIATLLIGR
jgi:hypothetical protein